MSSYSGFLRLLVLADNCAIHVSGLASTQKIYMRHMKPKKNFAERVAEWKLTVLCAIHANGGVASYFFIFKTVEGVD